MNVALTELAASSDISQGWNEQTEGFVVGTFYTTFDSPRTWQEYIQRSKRSKLAKLLNGRILETHEIESNRIWEFIIKDSKRIYSFYIGISNDIWTIFTNKEYSYGLLRDLVKYSYGIGHAWISPTQMREIIDKYAKIGSLQAISKSPSFTIPKRAPIPAKERKELPDIFFKKMDATVQFWAPREILYSDDPLAYEELKISKDYLNRISKAIFRTKFDNPGKSTIAVESDSIVSHKEGMPKATEIVFNSVFKLSTSWIDKVRECIPEFEIQYDSHGEILTLYHKRKPKELNFSVQDDAGFSANHLIKLEQILISGGSQTELVGYRISSGNDALSLRVMYPRFCQDALIDLTLDNEQIRVAVFPHSCTGPHILFHVYRTISERFAWSIGPIEVGDRWE